MLVRSYLEQAGVPLKKWGTPKDGMWIASKYRELRQEFGWPLWPVVVAVYGWIAAILLVFGGVLIGD
jgi:hypothetical protein